MNTFIKHTFIYFVSKGLPGILTFLGILYYSKKLDPAEYGVYSLIITVVGIVNILFFDWFRYGMSRFLPEFIAQQRRDEFILFTKSKVQIATLCLFIVVIIIYLLYPYLPNMGIDRWMVLLIGLLTLLQYFFTLFTQIFVTELKPLMYMNANFIRSILGVVLSIVFVYLGFGFIGLVSALVVSYFFSILFSFFKIRFPKSKLDLKLDKKLLRSILLYSIPLTASAGLSFILSYSNRFIINEFRGVEETGLFSLGFDFSQQTIGVFISIAATSATPIAMKLYTETGNSGTLKKHMNKSLLFIFLIALPIVIIFCTTSTDLSSLLLGKKFSKLNHLILPIISINAFILGIKSYYFDLFFYLKKETKFQLLILFIVATLNVILNCILVPKYGYVAAVWSGLITNLLAVILTYFVTKKLLYIPLEFLPIIKVCFAALAMLLIMFLFGNSHNLVYLILKVSCGIGVYLLVVSLFNKKVIGDLIKLRVK